MNATNVDALSQHLYIYLFVYDQLIDGPSFWLYFPFSGVAVPAGDIP